MTLYTQVANNRAKTFFFLLLFAALFLAVAWFFDFYFNSPLILYIAAAVVIVQAIVAWWSSDSVALASARCVPLDLDPVRDERVRRLTTNLAISAGLPLPRLFVIPEPAINAFSTGRDPKHAAVAVTLGAIDKLDDNELSGVIAHELSHIGNEDIRLMGLVMVMAGLVVLLSDILLRSMFWGIGGRRRDNDDGGGSGPLLIIGLILALLAPFFAMLIQLAISRKREFMADETGVLITRYPEGLIHALQKIEADEEPLMVANRGNAFMYFANPLHGHWLAGLFADHPPIEDRIRAIEQGSGMLLGS